MNGSGVRFMEGVMGSALILVMALAFVGRDHEGRSTERADARTEEGKVARTHGKRGHFEHRNRHLTPTEPIGTIQGPNIF